jgi:DNA-binding transcriptional LysR family regulator
MLIVATLWNGARDSGHSSAVHSISVRDLRRREADIAVRSGKPTDAELTATRLQDTPARLYATPDYLRSIGNPRSLADCSAAEFIDFREGDEFLAGLNALGFQLTPKSFPIHMENHLVLWELVKGGLGIGAIIEEVGDAEPRLRRILPDLVIPAPAWLVAHREVHTSRRVRLVFDLLVEALRPGRRHR